MILAAMTLCYTLPPPIVFYPRYVLSYSSLCIFSSISFFLRNLPSLLITCPYHLNLISLTFCEISNNFVVPLIHSFLILSSFGIPRIHISLNSNFPCCAFFGTQVFLHVTVLVLPMSCTPFILIFTFILLSHTTSDTHFQFFQ